MVEKSENVGFWPSLYDPFARLGTRLAEWVAPASEASSKDDVYRISLELPGVEEKDIEVTVHDGVLRVTGEKRTSREEKGETWFFSERQFGSFARSFRLPPDADETEVEADLKDGVLTVAVKKRAEAEPAARSVKIKTG